MAVHVFLSKRAEGGAWHTFTAEKRWSRARWGTSFLRFLGYGRTMGLAVAGIAALSFSPGLRPLPALGHAAARVQIPAMLLGAGATSWLADAAASSETVLMPDETSVVDVAAAAANVAEMAENADPGWFDLYRLPGRPLTD